MPQFCQEKKLLVVTDAIEYLADENARLLSLNEGMSNR